MEDQLMPRDYVMRDRRKDKSFRPGKYDHLLDGRIHKISRIKYGKANTHHLRNAVLNAARKNGLKGHTEIIDDEWITFIAKSQ